MVETIFLLIAALAAAFKAGAILIGVVWAFRSLLSQQSARLDYRYTHAKIPYLSGIRRKSITHWS